MGRQPSSCAWPRVLAVLCTVLHVLNAIHYEANSASFDVRGKNPSIFGLELSEEDLKILERSMGEHVTLFKEKLKNSNGAHRSKRDADSSPEDVKLSKEDVQINIGNGTQLPPVAQFAWNDERFLVAGSRIFSLSGGKLKPFLSGLPVKDGDIIRPFIYEDTIFIAIFNKRSAILHLYLLRSPGWVDMKFVQSIVGERIEDCEFFEHDGTLHMVLAIQSETNSSPRGDAMELVIFRWTGTSMDDIESFYVEGLRDISIIDAERIHFVLLHKSSSIQLWRFEEERGTQLIDQYDTQTPRVLQLETFQQVGEWYILLGGHETSHVIQQQGDRLRLRQILQHNTTIGETSWIRTYEKSDNSLQDSVTLLFQPVNEEKSHHFEIFASDSSGFFSRLFTTSSASFLGNPKFSMAFVEDVGTIGIYTVSANNANEYFLEAFTLSFNSSLWRPSSIDPLVQCLTDVEHLVRQLQSASADEAAERMKNLVHYKDNVDLLGMVVTVGQLSSTHSSYGEVNVLHNFTGSYEPPTKLEARMRNLQNNCENLSKESGNLLTPETLTFNGRLTISGALTVDNMVANFLEIDSVNRQNWDSFVNQAWRYSHPEVLLADVETGTLHAENVTVQTTIGGSAPSNWLLKSGGKINGKVSVKNLVTDGNINVGGNLLNGVDLREVVNATSAMSTISGAKSFRSITVETFATMSTINSRNFVSWASSAVTQRNEQPQRVTGTVTITGSASVADAVEANAINDVSVKEISQTVVNKNYNNLIQGTVTFVKPLNIRDVKVQSLNKLHTEDILSVSGEQVIRAKLAPSKSATIEVTGNLICDDINGVNFDDFLYANEHSTQDIQSPVRFNSAVTVTSLTVVNGTLNDLNVSELLDPREIRIDSSVEIARDVFADEVIVKNVNGINLSSLRKRYWTKSTDQNVNVAVSMRFEVLVEGNVTTQTFLGKLLDKDYFLTNVNQVLDANVRFQSDVTVMENVEVENLKEINGISLKALDEQVVKKKGSFNVLGNKVVDEVYVHGHLNVGETFNDLRIPEDVVLLNRSQNLKGIKFTNEVEAVGDVFSQHGDITLDKIGSVVLRDFINSAALISENATITGVTDFQTHVDVEDIIVRETINGVEIRKIFGEGVSLSRRELNFPRLTVIGNVVFKDTVEASVLNDYGIESNFDGVVNITNPGFISGHKRAAMHNINAKDASVKLFNDSPLDFSTTLMVSKDQTITVDYKAKTIRARNIEVRAINGKDLSGFVKTGKTDEVQLIQGSVEMEHLTVEAPLKIENRILNDCHVTEYSDVMAFKQFDSLRIENGSLKIERPLQNNPLLAKLATRTLRKNKAQVIDGAVTFNADVAVRNLDIPSNRAEKVDLRSLFNETMLKTGEQEVLGTIRYTDQLIINTTGRTQTLDVSYWNGVDVEDLIENVATVGAAVKLEAEKTFSGDMKVLNQLRLTGDINNLNHADLIKIAELNELPSVKFTSLVIANMTVRTGIIDGINLTDILQNRVPLMGNASVRSNLTFTETVHSDFALLKKVNNLSISDIVLKTAAPGQSVKGRKTLKNNLLLSGDVSVSVLNGRNPEETGAFVVLKDQPASFEYPLVFENGVSVLDQVCVETYGGENMTSLLSKAVHNITGDEKSHASTKPSRTLLTKLQRSRNHLTDFQFFEQIQQVPISFASGSNTSIHLQHCSVPTRKQSSTTDTAAGVLIATHSSESNSCRMSKRCKCHRSVIVPSDTTGRLNTLRTPARLKEYLENQTRIGYKIHLLSSADYIFVLAIETLPGCLSEKIKVAVLHPITFKLNAEHVLQVNGTVVDIALETDKKGTVYFAILKASSGVDIHSFDGHAFKYQQGLTSPKAVALAFVKYSEKLFLAVASYGLEAVSYVWSVGEDGLFAEAKQITTIGATDVIFTKADEELFLTFAQDPSSIAPYTENWSQLKVPAQVFLFSRTTNTFDLVQQLDIDRVISLTNLVIHGEPFIAAASFNGKVRIYRLISGQGFQAEQTFKIPGIKSIVGYAVKNETYLATVTESMTSVHVARLRGLYKPSVRV